MDAGQLAGLAQASLLLHQLVEVAELEGQQQQLQRALFQEGDQASAAKSKPSGGLRQKGPAAPIPSPIPSPMPSPKPPAAAKSADLPGGGSGEGAAPAVHTSGPDTSPGLRQRRGVAVPKLKLSLMPALLPMQEEAHAPTPSGEASAADLDVRSAQGGVGSKGVPALLKQPGPLVQGPHGEGAMPHPVMPPIEQPSTLDSFSLGGSPPESVGSCAPLPGSSCGKVPLPPDSPAPGDMGKAALLSSEAGEEGESDVLLVRTARSSNLHPTTAKGGKIVDASCRAQSSLSLPGETQ